MQKDPREKAWLRLGRFVIAHPACILIAGGLLTLGLIVLAWQAGMERRAADACALAMLATAALTGGVLGWIFAHVHRAKPTPEETLIQEVMDELEMEEQLKARAPSESQNLNQPSREPWEKPGDWWKGEGTGDSV